MNRNDKIQLLQKIKEGKLSVRAIQPPRAYIFTELSNPKRYLDSENKEYTEKEYQNFCNEVETVNKELKRINAGGEQNSVITIVYKEGKTIL